MAFIFVLPALIAVDGVKKEDKTLAVAIDRNTSSFILNEDSSISLVGETMVFSSQDFSSNSAVIREQNKIANQLYSSLSKDGAQFAGEYSGENIFFASCGMNIRALRSGLVVDTGEPRKWNNGRGGYVVIEDTYYSGSIIAYSHLSEIYVNEGDFIETGEELGSAGSSGDLLPGGVCQLGIALK